MNPFNFFRNMMAGGLLCSAALYSPALLAQQNAETGTTSPKTITIHVTKEINGKTTVIDTTVVTDGDFDADAYLRSKGVGDDEPAENNQVEKRIIIRKPGSATFEFHDFGPDFPDSLFDGKDFGLNFKPDENMERRVEKYFNMPFDWNDRHFDVPDAPDMPFRYNYRSAPGNSGLEEYMPFGNPDKMVIKKKHHGKKVIITYKDDDSRQKDNAHRHDVEREGKDKKHEERVIIRKSQEPGQPLPPEPSQPAKNRKKVVIIEEEKK